MLEIMIAIIVGLAQVQPFEKQINTDNDAIELILSSSFTIITKKEQK